VHVDKEPLLNVDDNRNAVLCRDSHCNLPTDVSSFAR
jgi:hypothetical protein